MQVVPEWAPNVHPMVVHLPIALLSAAVVVDFFALVIRPWRWLRPAAVTMYLLGAAGAVAAYFTGQAAADSVTLSAQAQTVLTDHANLAWWTMWSAGLYALVRVGAVLYEKARRSLALHGLLFAIGLAGMYLPWQTGEYGAQMVFEHGVGVQAAEVENPVQHEHDDHEGEGVESDSTSGSNGGPQVAENGSWRWTPGSRAAEVLHSGAFTWLTGSAGALQAGMRSIPERGPVLVLQPREPAMFTAGPPLESIQVEAGLNLSDFDGTAMLVHHVEDAQNYDFLALENGTMRLGRVRDGEQTVLAEGSYEPAGWLPVRLVSDQSHYRGYLDGEMIAHGHGEAPPPGAVGLHLDGSGTVLLGEMQVQSLRDEE